MGIPAYTQVIPNHPPVTDEFLSSLERSELEKEFGHTKAKAHITNRNGWLWGDANDAGTLANNEALFFVQQSNMLRAKEVLEDAVKKSPQNFMARYNLGRIYLFYKEHQQAHIQFNRARSLVPQYHKNYYYIGKALELGGDYNAAFEYYRKAYQKNPYDLSSLVALGDLLLDRKRITEAKNVYKFCLRQDHGYNDALIGMGKVKYHEKLYYAATVWFDYVDLDKPYKKEYHYYYAESAFYARMYKLAASEFQTMLAYPTDAIYDRVSLSRVRFRLKQARRLALEQAAE